MEDQIENSNSEMEDTTADAETTAEDTTEDVGALKAKLSELEGTNRQLFERAKKAEGFVKVDGKWVKAPKAEEAVRTEAKLEATTGELTETQLDYLDLKGITADEDIAVIQSVMKRAGLTVRQALSDEFVQSRLAANAKKREVQAATPSSTRRSGNPQNDVDGWLAKVESGQAKLSDIPDFTTRAAVVEAREKKQNTNLPPWQR